MDKNFIKNNLLTKNKKFNIQKLKKFNITISIEDLHCILYNLPEKSYKCYNPDCSKNTKFNRETKIFNDFCTFKCELNYYEQNNLLTKKNYQ